MGGKSGISMGSQAAIDLWENIEDRSIHGAVMIFCNGSFKDDDTSGACGKAVVFLRAWADGIERWFEDDPDD